MSKLNAKTIINNQIKIMRKNSMSRRDAKHVRPEIPEGLYELCSNCKSTVTTEKVKENLFRCPNCNHNFRLRAYERLDLLIDKYSFKEFSIKSKHKNPLKFERYDEKIIELQNKTKLDEAVITGYAKIGSYPCVIAIMDSYFLMGSMGSVVGEKITKAIEKATVLEYPLIIVSTSGGARMQEGIVSLMQMAKTSAALVKHNKKKLLYISVLTDPTTGGVTASFASLGDIIIAENNALIGFAGPRVIEQTIKQKLPEGFQRAEFMKECGFIDIVVERNEMRNVLYKLLKVHGDNNEFK
ncbi:MAG: acetyl-CoA carboxylase, carboxyltransferase subunit beta [Bacilli bacterium]